uniref:Uncharacterized protein n=1 Tax=Cacopsylla melanoneura TaxID=428564 RepID=A0A8D9BQ12_9HEMI
MLISTWGLLGTSYPNISTYIYKLIKTVLCSRVLFFTLTLTLTMLVHRVSRVTQGWLPVITEIQSTATNQRHRNHFWNKKPVSRFCLGRGPARGGWGVRPSSHLVQLAKGG